MSHLKVVVGGQFGSEAKGHVTRQLVDQALAQSQDAHVINIRVAGPNAGHIAYDPDGHRWPLRQVPVGGTNPDERIRLHIASGSEIDLPVLLTEIDSMDACGLNVSGRLTISPEATMLYAEHKYREGAAKMHENIGSTGKGIGAARADRVMRTAKRLIDDKDAMQALRKDRGINIVEFGDANLYGLAGDRNHTIVIEGTQGYGLGLRAGFYPQCTSSNTRAIDFLAMADLNPWASWVDTFEVWIAARVYPIRVAGNSGPLAGETTWEELGLPEERTTVTNKVRRVGDWDPDLIRMAVVENGGTPIVRLALTMADQKFPWIEGEKGDYDSSKIEIIHTEEIEDFLSEIEGDAGAPVRMITTSPTTALFRDPINPLLPTHRY